MLKQLDIEKVFTKRFPEPVALIISQDSKGKINVCPIGFFSLISWDPKIWSIGLYREHYTTQTLKETKEYVLCLPSIEQANDVLYCGSVHGWEIDKTKSTKFEFIKSQLVTPPLIDHSIACFECKVIKEVEVGDHFVFFGEVVAAHESDKDWGEKIYNLGDKQLVTFKSGNKSVQINFSPEDLD